MSDPSKEARLAGAGEPRRVATLAAGPPALLLAGAAVAVAAGGSQLLLPAASPTGVQLWAVRAIGVALVAVGAWGLVSHRTSLGRAELADADPTLGGVRAAATLMGVVTVLALLNPPPPRPADAAPATGAGVPAPSAFGSDAPKARQQEANTRGGESILTGEESDVPVELLPWEYVAPEDRSPLRRAARALSWIVLLGLALVLARHLNRRIGARALELSLEPPVAPAAAEAGLAASLSEVAAVARDPRAQITAAYRRLLAALAEAGAVREPQEAPHEHLRRALAPLGLRPEPLHRLAGLYVFAQFSARPVTERHRQGAAEALAESLGQLRAGAR